MKYIDADKIRTEIKRLKAENNCGTDEFIAAKDIAYDKVFDFLEILEEPVSDDLEEAAENPYVLNDVSHAAFEYERTRNDLDARSDNEVVRRAFIAGAEWQKIRKGGIAMTTKELIREKIDSFYAEYKAKFHQNGEPYNLGIIDGLDMAERILDTLPDESVTDCHDLEKEIKEQIYARFYDLDGIAVIGTSGYAEVKDMEDIARHFAEWGAEHLAGVSKTISEDLEEAAEKHASGFPFANEWQSIANNAFKAGAEWMKAEMIKEDGN